MANEDYLNRLLCQAEELTHQLADVQRRIQAYGLCLEGEFLAPWELTKGSAAQRETDSTPADGQLTCK